MSDGYPDHDYEAGRLFPPISRIHSQHYHAFLSCSSIVFLFFVFFNSWHLLFTAPLLLDTICRRDVSCLGGLEGT